MCSVIVLFRPGHDWPILWASNRDEMLDRPWLPPGRHWPDRPEVVAGRDALAGGSWLGINDSGLVAGILNRVNSLGPTPGKRSRGELVLDALDLADATDAVAMLTGLNSKAYRPFNMVIADNTQAFWLWHADGKVSAEVLPPGYSMITAHDRNDPLSRRIRHYLPQWELADVPKPESGDWQAWEKLLACREIAPGGTVFDSMNIVSNTGFGTVSSSLIALPGVQHQNRRPVWRFTPARPDKAAWQGVSF